jgi:GTP cyclohydrolase I
MTPFESVLRDMPDIANDAKAEVAGKLAWVGMNEIEMPVRIEAGHSLCEPGRS